MASLNDIETKIQSIIDKLSIKITTGVLPLTFTAKGGTAVNWEIRGNDDVYEGQQGVGERTDNLFNPNEQIIINGVPYIGSTYPAGKYRIYNVSNFPCYYKIGESGATGTVNIPNNVYLNAGDTVYIWCSISSNRKICVSEGVTVIPYEPYGYQIPLTISKQGQTDKNYDIFIGDAPLTEGKTVSKASTGVDIELFEGENTISTTLYNKPEMTIKYKY